MLFRSASALAKVVGDISAVQLYDGWFKQAQAAYESCLWNGEYYDFDCSTNGHHDSIMAGQLAGQWYAQALGLGDIVPPERTRSVLKKVYNYNVLRFGGGEMGAVNGMRPDGTVDRSSNQAAEVWTGVTYALAAFMLQNGMKEEALRTAQGVYKVTYETKGYWFRTPEAWDEGGNFRASMYMRPQAIWAMEHAYGLLKKGASS